MAPNKEKVKVPLDTFEELNLVFRSECDDRLFPVSAFSHVPTNAFPLSPQVEGMHVENMHLEDSLNSVLDLHFVCLRVYLEDHLVGSLFLKGSLFGDDGTADDVIEVLHDP